MTGNGLCVMQHSYEPERPRQALPGGYLCGGCHRHADRMLSEIPDLIDDLERALIPGGGNGPKITGDPERALAYNEKPGDARRYLLDWLGSWTRLIAEERGHDLPADLSTAGQVRFHRTQLENWTGSQPWVDEYVNNLRANLSAARGILAGQRRKYVPLGNCPDIDRCDLDTRTEQRCTGTLVAVIDLDDDMLPAEVACTSCGTAYTARDLPDLGRRLTGGHAWLTTAQVAQVLSISESRVRAVAVQNGWRRRDAEKVRPSRWHADDVEATRSGVRVGA